MITIHKYPLIITDTQIIECPAGAQPLSIKYQDHGWKLWAMVETENPPSDLTIVCVGTGQEVPNNIQEYIDTVIDGTFVWHFFAI